jgi:hypothetical protein
MNKALMTDEKLAYIEEAGMHFEVLGMTRMAGRVFAYLLVSDRDACSFDEIREALHASKGSISMTLRQLQAIGFVEPVSLPRDRKTYFRPGKIPIGRLLRDRLRMMGEFSRLLERAHDLKEREDGVSEWLVETASFYRWIEDGMEEMIDRWDREHNQIIASIYGEKR